MGKVGEAVAALALAVMLAVPDEADADLVTGKEMCERCSGHDAIEFGTRTPEALAGASYCSGFVTGFLDGWVFRTETSIDVLPFTDEERNQMKLEIAELLRPAFCVPPDGRNVGRLIEAFVGYCKLKPPDDKATGRTHFLLALSEAFPCSPQPSAKP